MAGYKFNNKNGNTKLNWKWILTIIFMTVVVCGSISFFSDLLLRRVNLLVAFIILVVIIIIGIIFDIIGIAVTVANEVPFHAMSSKKIKEAKISIQLLRNADKVASICNDVVGDVCGIVSGSVGALIAAKIILNFSSTLETIISAVIGTLIGTATIVGKSIGKSIAISKSNEIVYEVSRVLYFFKRNR